MRLLPALAVTALTSLIALAAYAQSHEHMAAHTNHVVAQSRDGASLPDPATPAMTVGGPFTMVNQDGKTVTDKDFHGKYMLLFFGFTFCPDICPTELQTIQDALELAGKPIAAKVQPVFVTVDPARDTPDVIKDYLKQFGDNLVGLTGSDVQVAAIAKAYKIYYNKASNGNHGEGEEDADYMMDHSSFTYLMGPDGAFIKVFPAGVSVDDLAAGLKTTVK